MYFFDLPGFHPINGVDTDDHGKYPYLHFKDTVFVKDNTNYIDSYFPFKNVNIAEGKTAFVSEKNLLAIFKYDPNFRDDLLIDHGRAASKELLSSIKEDFHKGYSAGIRDFPRQIKFAINLVDSPVKEIKLRNFIDFCGDHLFFEGFATPNCLFSLGFIQAYLLKAFGEYQNLIQSIDQSLAEEKFEKSISKDVALAEAIQENEISKKDLGKENISEYLVPAEPLDHYETAKVDLVDKITAEDLGSSEAFQEDEKFMADLVPKNIPEEALLEVLIQQYKKTELDVVEEVTDVMDEMKDISPYIHKKGVHRERLERIPLDYATEEIISLWMILLEVWKCKPINSIQVFFEPAEVLDLLGSMFDDSVNKKMLPQSEHKYFNLPPGKYDRIINLLMHVTYKFNTDRNNISLEKYCEALIGTFSCYKKTKVASLRSNINKERGNIIKSIKSLPESGYKNDFLKVLEKINEYKT